MKIRPLLYVAAFAGGALTYACSSSSSPTTPVDGGHTGDSGHTGPGSSTGTGSGSSKPKHDAGNPHSSGSGSSDSGSDDAGDDDGGDAGFEGDADFSLTFACATPDASPSNGSCVTVVAANDAGTGIQCNPVTNAPCPAGYECDESFDNNFDPIGFICYPPPNTATACQPCENAADGGPYCGGGLTCFPTDDTFATSECAKYCCTNDDCGGGTCVSVIGGSPWFAPISSALGVCVTTPTDAGAPDAAKTDAAQTDASKSDAGTSDAHAG